MNTLKVFEKNFFKHKTTNFLSIGGLSLGISVAILLGWWAINEMRADRFHSDHEKIFRICREGFINNENIRIGTINAPLAKELMGQLPQIEDKVRIAAMGKERFQIDDMVHYEEAIMLAEPAFFHFFDFPLKQGDVNTCLEHPDQIVITEKLAAKYFGDDDPVGQSVKFMDRNWQISAVMYDVPANSHLQFDALCAMAGLPQYDNAPWGWDLFNVYVKIPPESDLETIAGQITDIAIAGFPLYETVDIHHFLQPLSEIRFDTQDFRFDNAKKTDKRFVMIFAFMAIAILAIACINFTNLFISTAFLRARSIGLKKANGADKGSLIREFYLETSLFVLISMLAGVFLAKLTLPLFNTLADTNVILDFTQPALLALLLGITVITILMAGSFPALFLTRYRAAATLKGEMEEKNISVFQKSLVILQFAASIILLVSVFTIRRQVNFFRTTDLGFNTSNIICVNATGPFSESYDMIKQELERYPEIIEVTAKNGLPNEWRHGEAISASTEDDPFIVEICDIKENYLDMLDIDVVAGEPFSDYNDSLNYVWINEQAAKLLGYENPVNQIIEHRTAQLTIRGVVRDIKSKSLHTNIDPQVYIKIPRVEAEHSVMIKISDDQKAAIARVQEKWEEVNPEYPFEFRFLDQAYDDMYQNEARAGDIVTWGMFIAMFITIIGLFAMARYTTERRTKEIGVRMVNGAELIDILVLINKNFLKWVILSCVVALPAGWFLMQGWLESFAYRSNLSWWILVLSAMTSLLIAVATVSWQSFIAARKNPVESLRYE